VSLKLYAHPFSSYCQKVLIALYENDVSFDYRLLALDDRQASEELAALWPLKRFPVLVDGGSTIVEASIIIEHLALHHPGPVKLIPDDAAVALEARMLDRFFDNYISTPQQKIVFDRIRADADRDPYGVGEAHDVLETAYAWLDARMAGRQWAAGNAFSLADCAAAPALFYADWTHAIARSYRHVRDYRSRLLERPSFRRAVEEARPYRAFFPLGAPDRD
jgi:glutathione S-transferase